MRGCKGGGGYPRRQRIIPVRYGIDEYVDIAFLGGEEPQSIEEALGSKLSKKWKKQLIQSTN